MFRLFLTHRLTLLRGVAEVLIIIVGVLLALLVDEWRSNISASRDADQYMERLEDDLRSTITALEWGIWYADRGDKYGSWLIGTIALSHAEVSIDDMIVNAMIASYVPPIPDVFLGRNTTYRELLATNGLASIPDLEVRIRLAEYFAEFDRIAARVSFWSDSGYRDWARGALSPDLVEMIEASCNDPELPLSGCDIEISTDDRDSFLRLLRQDNDHVRQELYKFVQYWRRLRPLLIGLKDDTEGLLEQLESGA